MSHHLLNLILYPQKFQSEKAVVQNWRENLSVRTFEVTIYLKNGFLVVNVNRK